MLIRPRFWKKVAQHGRIIEDALYYCWVRVAVLTWNIITLRNTVKKWFRWLEKWIKKKTLKFSVTHNAQLWFGRTLGNQKFYREMDFYWNARSWNKKKTKTRSSTGADIVNCLQLNVAYIYFASDLWTVLGTRVITKIVELICTNI